jgi:nucleotide-binding universal stress UspA family protein
VVKQTRTSAQRILVPLDGSPLAELALPRQPSLSQLPHTEVILLQVVPPVEDVIVVDHGESGLLHLRRRQHAGRHSR